MHSSGKGQQSTLLLLVDSHWKLWNLPEGTQEAIAERFPNLRVLAPRNPAALRAALPQADILYCWHLPRELVSLARRLRWIHTPSAGVEHLLSTGLRHSDVIITNSRGIASDAMADHVFAMILALSRRLTDSIRFQAQHRWERETIWTSGPLPVSLKGKVLGIIGLGGVGLDLVGRARAFGMTVIASRRTEGKPPRGVERLVTPEHHHELLEKSDFVVIAAPLTAETRGLIGPKELRRMKKTAYLVNVGRGEQVDEGALVRALREGWIAGAALDVFQREPLPRASVLWRLPGLLITPHYAGTYPEHMARATDLFLENLRLFLAGKTKKLRNVIDKKRGY